MASGKRATGVSEWLRDRGVAAEDLARVRAPAGLDLGATDHAEIAVAVLAELVQLRASGRLRGTVEVVEPEIATDPVCGMTVAVATSHHRAEHAGRTHHFCAAGCQRAFEADPAAFVGA